MQTYLVLCLTVVPPTSFHFNMSSSLTLNEVSLHVWIRLLLALGFGQVRLAGLGLELDVK